MATTPTPFPLGPIPPNPIKEDFVWRDYFQKMSDLINARATGVYQLVGDVMAGPGVGTQTATLATVNASPGTFGDATHIPIIVVNGKGLATGITVVGALPTAAPLVSKSVNYTTVLSDANGVVLHPSSDANTRTFTIDSNANVAYPLGTAITFVNRVSQVLSIAIASDTLVLANSASTGTRSLALNGIATALKIETTLWVISGNGLT